jgi:predicted glycosyltransferase
MNILLIAYHPSEALVLKNISSILKEKHNVKVLFTEKEGIVEQIIKTFDISYSKIGYSRRSLIGKYISAFLIVLKLLKEVIYFKPNIVFSSASIYSGLVTKLLKIHHICYLDTETAVFHLKYAIKFIDTLLIPDCFYLNFSSKKVIRFKGYKELSYLHPNYFKRDSHVLGKYGLSSSDKIVLLRFSALKAMHDVGLNSYSNFEDKIYYYLGCFEKKAKVFISMTEKELGVKFQKYRLNIDPNDYINILSFCTLYIGEGTSSASEAGLLGVPWIVLRPQPLGYLNDQEHKYKLGFRTSDIDKAFLRAMEWLDNDLLLSIWKEKASQVINDKIDVASFFSWFIENYPKSHQILNQNSDYQLNFK